MRERGGLPPGGDSRRSEAQDEISKLVAVEPFHVRR